MFLNKKYTNNWGVFNSGRACVNWAGRKPYKIPPRVIQELGRELSVPLSFLFNKKLLELGEIPLEWMNANVVAIF